MKQQVTFSIYIWMQPNEYVWKKVVELTSEWNEDHRSPQWIVEDESEGNVYFRITLEDVGCRIAKELERILAEYQDLYGVEYDKELTERYDETDLQNADMVGFFGFQPYDFGILFDMGLSALRNLPKEQLRFVANFEKLFGPTVECTGCSWSEPLSRQYTSPLIVDEYCLDKKYNINTGKWETTDRPWDVITLPGGTTLISEKVLRAFQSQHILGYQTSNVLSKSTGESSTKIFELLPCRYIRKLCGEHTVISGEVCRVCGRILGDLEGFASLQKTWVDDDEIIGRMPGGLRLIYCAQRVCQILVGLDAHGVVFDQPILLCQHQEV